MSEPLSCPLRNQLARWWITVSELHYWTGIANHGGYTTHNLSDLIIKENRIPSSRLVNRSRRERGCRMTVFCMDTRSSVFGFSWKRIECCERKANILLVKLTPACALCSEKAHWQNQRWPNSIRQTKNLTRNFSWIRDHFYRPQTCWMRYNDDIDKINAFTFRF